MSRCDFLNHLGFATAQAMANATKPPPMTLPKEMIEKINDEADAYIRGLSIGHSKGHKRDGYISGATEWAAKAQTAIDTIEQIVNSPVPTNEREMASWIETARNLAETALAKYKEVTE